MDIVDRIRTIARDYTAANNIEIVDITYRREQGGMTLRILADRPEGISVSDCEEFNKYLSEALDRGDVIQGHYILEISSPGLDRPIKTDRDFERAMGRLLEITTYEMIDGVKTREGRFVGMNKESIVIERDSVSVVIPKSKIALARLKIEF